MLQIIYKHHKKIIFLFILLMVFIQRGTTLFIDFYDVDEISDVLMTNEIVDGGKIYIDAIPARPFYFLYFYTVFMIFGSGNYFALHLATIFLIFATCFTLYKINRELFNEKAGYVAALLYAIFISALYEYYLAVHGEVVYNLPVALSFYSFILAEKKNRPYLYYTLAGIICGIAFLTKGHTILLLFFYGVYVVILKSYLTRSFWINVRDGLFILGGFCLTLLIFSATLLLLGVFENFYKFYILGAISYAIEGFTSMTWGAIIIKVTLKIVQNIAAQLPLWIFLIAYLIKLKWDFKKEPTHLILLTFFLISFSGIFLAGMRLYNHYFIQYLPALTLIAGYEVTLLIQQSVNKKRTLSIANILILLSSLYFGIWDYTNTFLAYYYPEKAFPQNHALIPRKSYKAISHWIKANSKPTDCIVQWGDCIEIYYYSERKPGMRFLWSSGYGILYDNLQKKSPKINKIFSQQQLKQKQSLPINKQWSFKTADDLQYSIIIDIDNPKKRPKYIIDTAPSNFRDFGKYPLSHLPILNDYIMKHYHYIKTVNQMKVYELKAN